jgi:hypothetical protein
MLNAPDPVETMRPLKRSVAPTAMGGSVDPAAAGGTAVEADV